MFPGEVAVQNPALMGVMDRAGGLGDERLRVYASNQ